MITVFLSNPKTGNNEEYLRRNALFDISTVFFFFNNKMFRNFVT